MYKYNAQVERVIDGDTIVLTIDLGFHMHFKTNVRLARIDAIERKMDPERLATLEVVKWAAQTNNRVVVDTFLDRTDKYGRVVAEVWATTVSLDDPPKATNLSDNMVEAGFAVYRDYKIK